MITTETTKLLLCIIAALLISSCGDPANNPPEPGYQNISTASFGNLSTPRGVWFTISSGHNLPGRR